MKIGGCSNEVQVELLELFGLAFAGFRATSHNVCMYQGAYALPLSLVTLILHSFSRLLAHWALIRQAWGSSARCCHNAGGDSALLEQSKTHICIQKLRFISQALQVA